MGRISFKRKSKTSSPSAQSPGEQTGSPAVTEQANDDAPLASNPIASPTPTSPGPVTLSKSYSTSAKVGRSSSIGRAPRSHNADSGKFSEQVQRLRARLQSVVQGVREVAQSLDEPHSLIANVRDQLQTRQDAVAARRNHVTASAYVTPSRDSGSATAAAVALAPGSTAPGLAAAAMPPPPPPSLSRAIVSSRGGGGSFRYRGGADAAVAATDNGPFVALSAGSQDPRGGGAAIVDGGAADGANLSVKARVAEVERRSRSSGGAMDPPAALSGSMPVSVSELLIPAVAETAVTEGSSPRSSAGATAAPPLLATRSFGGNGRRGAELSSAMGILSPTRRSHSGRAPGSPKATPPASRPNSGTWRPVMMPPPNPGAASHSSSVAAARSYHWASDEVASAMTYGSGIDAAAALAAADIIAADAAELLGSGDDSLLAATSNPLAAAAYLRDHPDTLRELWTLRVRVRTQETELASMVVQLSTKNAQLDQAQTSLQAKERELAVITQRLTGVLIKLQSFQAAHNHELQHHHHHHQSFHHNHQLQNQQEQEQLRRSSASEVIGAAAAAHVDGPHSAPVPAAAATSPPSLPQPSATVTSPDGGDAPTAAAVTTTASTLPASSTPQTPLRSAPVATSTAGASHFAAARAALQAEADAAVVAAAGAIAGGGRAPRNTSVSASSSPAVSAGSSPEGAEVSLPPPPSVKNSGSASQVLEAVAAEANARQGGSAGDGTVHIAPRSSSSFLPRSVAAAAAASLGGKLEPFATRAAAAAAAAASGGNGDGCSSRTAPAASHVEALGAAVVEPVSAPEELAGALQERLLAKDEELAKMMAQLSVQNIQLNQAQRSLQHKEKELTDVTQRLNGVLSQVNKAAPPPQPQHKQELQQQPEPQSQPRRRRRASGLLRMLLLQLGPSLACVGLLLRETSVHRRLPQQLRHGLLAAASSVSDSKVRALPVPLPSSPPSSPSRQQQQYQEVVRSPRSQPQQEQQPQHKEQQHRPQGNVAPLRRRVMKAVAAAAAAAGVRPAGARRSRSPSVTPAAPASPTPSSPVADTEEALTPWTRECKSHMCKIVRPPPKEFIYY